MGKRQRKPNGREDAPPQTMPDRSQAVKVALSDEDDNDSNRNRAARTDFLSPLEKIKLDIFREETRNAEASYD